MDRISDSGSDDGGSNPPGAAEKCSVFAKNLFDNGFQIKKNSAKKINNTMKTAIIYASKYGTTEKVARAIADRLKETTEVELFSLKKNPNPNINEFDMVILGSSIYAGQSSKKIKLFCKENQSVLLQKKLGLFICGMHPTKEEQNKEMKTAYPEVLQKKAIVFNFLGGEFLMESMNFFERFIARMIAKTKTSVHRINWDGIDEFVKKLSKSNLVGIV